MAKVGGVPPPSERLDGVPGSWSWLGPSALAVLDIGKVHQQMEAVSIYLPFR